MLPSEVIRELGKKGRVLVQLPEGLKTKATAIAAELASAGFKPIISSDPCFGACDLRALKGAKTLHIGHSPFMKRRGVVYWEYHYDQPLAPAVEQALPLLGERVGLFTTAQHLGKIEEAVTALKNAGKEVLTAKGKRTKEYQLLGCDASGAAALKDKVDSFLYIGGGRFHPIAIAYYTKRPVIAVDPFSLEAQEVDAGVWETERALRQAKAMNAESFGVCVSSKPGQENWAEAERVKKQLEAAGKTAVLIYGDLLSPDALLPYKVDAFVITGCPRIVIDDWKNYKKPILLPDELDL